MPTCQLFSPHILFIYRLVFFFLAMVTRWKEIENIEMKAELQNASLAKKKLPSCLASGFFFARSKIGVRKKGKNDLPAKCYCLFSSSLLSEYLQWNFDVSIWSAANCSLVY